METSTIETEWERTDRVRQRQSQTELRDKHFTH